MPLSGVEEVTSTANSMLRTTDSPTSTFLFLFRNQNNLGNRAGDLREHGVSVGADQPDGSNHDDQNYSQHDSVFGDVLAILGREGNGRLAHERTPFVLEMPHILQLPPTERLHFFLDFFHFAHLAG